MNPGTLGVVVRRVIAASPGRLFAAWTTAAQLQAWWGPRGVRCTGAQVDARVGGAYRIDNQLPDGAVLSIVGEFLVVDPPRELVFTWRLHPGDAGPEQVTVRFEPCATGTEVVVVHERIATPQARDQHADGWRGCLAGLEGHIGGSAGAGLRG
jgi:uncharacterized protein YndB with AHSA1/START domain